MTEAAIWIGGALMLAFPVALVKAARRRSWTRATAKVVRFEPHPDPSEDGVARVVQFKTADGQVHEFTDTIFANWGHRTGAKVLIIYPPNEPQMAQLSDSQYSFQLLIGTIGFLVFIIGIY